MANEEIIFQVHDWREYNEDITLPSKHPNYNEDKCELKNKYIFRMFGRTIDGKSVHAKVMNFIPYFYVRVPDFWLNRPIEKVESNILDKKHMQKCESEEAESKILDEKHMQKCESEEAESKILDEKHMQNSANKFIEELKKRNFNIKKHFVKYEFIERHEYHGFTDDALFKYIRLIFDNSYAMKSFAKTLGDKISLGNNSIMHKYKILENNIDPFLRACHVRDLKLAGWIRIKKSVDNNEVETTTCDINVLCDWRDLYPANKINLGSAPFRTCSYDIECRPEDGVSFPTPQIKGDQIIQIGSVFSKYGSGIYRKHIITLGTCDPIDGAEVVSVSTEKELLIEWTRLIQEEDPDFFVGYNIFFFDDPFMYKRSTLPHINCTSIFDKLAKVKDHSCKFIQNELNTKGRGDNSLNYIDTPGRVKIDLMKVVQRDYKLVKYTLDFVAETFIQEIINKYTIIDKHTLKIESKNLHFIIIGNYVKIIDNIASKYGIKDINEENNNEENVEEDEVSKT